MKLEWRLPTPVEVGPLVLEAASNRALVARILARRGMMDPAVVRRFLEPAVFQATPPQRLHDLPKGVSRIQQAIREEQRILVWGDFDVDGQTATSLLVSALRGLGAQIDYHIPVRETESHGIQPDVLRGYLDEGIGLLLTCDTGIAAVEAVNLANVAGVDVVVTDHHDLPATLPAAHAIINPKFHQETEVDHPLRGLPGVGVAYKVVEALYKEAGREQELARFLDLVALGIVADLALQQDDTRYLLQRGLEVLRKTTRPGLRRLMQNSKVEAAYLNDEDIGFQLGPRLNAVGRLADANISVPLLTTMDSTQAEEIAVQLERLNEDRKYETQAVYDSAIAQIERDPSLLQYAVLVMGNGNWHEGVIGIVASRLVEEFGKPTILLATPEGQIARGSARSVEGYHITQAIGTQEDLLLGFGGHPMAAGLSMRGADLDTFRRGVSKAIIEQRDGRDPEPVLEIEAELPLGELTLETALQLEALAPFGPGNPPVHILCRGVQVEQAQEIGKDKGHRKLVVRDDAGATAEILWWGGSAEPLPEDRMDMVVRIRAGSFRGERTITTTLQDFRPAAEAIASTTAERTANIVDCRGELHPQERLDRILSQETAAQVWGEPATDERMKSRGELEDRQVLVLWTVPPDRTVLRQLLQRTEATKVYVFAADAAVDEYPSFMRRFGGLVKFALESYQGRSTIAALAAAMGHSERTISCGLEVLPALAVGATCENGGGVYFTRCDRIRVDKAEEMLKLLLYESRAFRQAFRTAERVERFC
jgi:single-stranded-DNA-specific exonuclease